MSESALWKFSLRFYARPGVAHACIELQDAAGIDVNLLFLLMFFSECGRSVTGDDVARIDAAIAPWRNEVVKPLRAVRRKLKNELGVRNSEALRSDVKRIELESERLQQEALFAMFPAASMGTAAPREATVRANLTAYAQYLGGAPQAPLDVVLRAFLAM